MTPEISLLLRQSRTGVHPRVSAANELLCDLGVLGGESTGPEWEETGARERFFCHLGGGWSILLGKYRPTNPNICFHFPGFPGRMVV